MGMKFVFARSNIKHPRDAVYFASELIKVVRGSFLLNNNDIFTTTSVGIRLSPFDGADRGTQQTGRKLHVN